jgi:molybdopterin molybdotransferase
VEVASPGEFARKSVANAHRNGGRSGIRVLHHIEMMVERRDFKHFSGRETHFVRKRDDMVGRDATERVLNLVEMFDQEIATSRLVAEQGSDLFERLRIDGTALGGAALLLFSFIVDRPGWARGDAQEARQVDRFHERFLVDKPRRRLLALLRDRNAQSVEAATVLERFTFVQGRAIVGLSLGGFVKCSVLGVCQGSPDDVAAFCAAFGRRRARYPIAFINGVEPFAFVHQIDSYPFETDLRRLGSKAVTVNELFKVRPPREALETLLRHCVPLERSETVELTHALGRVTAVGILANETLPAFARSTMDGYAVRAADTFGASESAPAYLGLCGEIAMGRLATFPVGAFETARIHTGAMLPPGADAVVMVEETNARGAEIEILGSVAPGENIVGVGEDIRAGDVAVPAGRRLRAADLGGLSALGRTQVRVVARPRIAILSTGDEVVDVAASPEIGQVRDVNAATVAAVVAAAGGTVVPCGIAPDNEAQLELRARVALDDADALVMSAGSSVSYRDYTARVVERLGAPGILVHGIAIKPGKPTLLAVAGGKPVVGLPGNPASALVLAWRVVAPLVRRLGGEVQGDEFEAEIDAVLTAPIRSRPGREDYVPCSLERDRDGIVRATPIFGKSNLIFTLVRSDGMLVVPLDRSGFATGAAVRVILP